MVKYIGGREHENMSLEYLWSLNLVDIQKALTSGETSAEKLEAICTLEEHTQLQRKIAAIT